MKVLQIVLISAGVFAPVTKTISGAIRVAQAGETAAFSVPEGQSSILMAKLTLRNGASRLVQLEGVGCTRSICSRTHLQGQAEHGAAPRASLESIEFNAIDAIQNATPNQALFVLKDGARQRLSLVADSRVLYLRDESGTSETLDLAEVTSLEFLPK